MRSILGRAFSTLRVWLGLNDPSENRLHAAHGWLLPTPKLAPILARATTTDGLRGSGASGRRD